MPTLIITRRLQRLMAICGCDTMGALTGVRVEPGFAVVTDGSMLVALPIDYDGPAATIKIARSPVLAEERPHRAEEHAEIDVEELLAKKRLAVMTSRDRALGVVLSDGQDFPAWRAIIPNERPARVVGLNAAKLLALVKACPEIATRTCGEQVAVALSFTPGRLDPIWIGDSPAALLMPMRLTDE